MAYGKRYSKEEKEEIMQYRQNHTYRETVDKYNISQMTLARWARKRKNKTIPGSRFIGDKNRHRINIATDERSDIETVRHDLDVFPRHQPRSLQRQPEQR